MDPVTNYHSRTARKAAKSFSRPRKLSLQTSKASASITAATPVARDDAYGSFTPTTPVFSSLRHIASSRPRTSLFVPFTRKRHTSMFEWPDSDGSSPPSSPMLSQAPSICRTISYDGTEVYSPASSSTTTLPDIKQPATVPFPKTKLNPILDTLEKESKLCSQRVHCATCGKAGSDFPRCGRCGEMWCSRACRLRNGKRHQCHARTSSH